MRVGFRRLLSIVFKVIILLLIAATGIVVYSVFFGKTLVPYVEPYISPFVEFVKSDSEVRIMLLAVMAVEVILFVLSFFVRSGKRSKPHPEVDTEERPAAGRKKRRNELRQVGSSEENQEKHEKPDVSDFRYAEPGVEPNFPGKLCFPFFKPLPTFRKLGADAAAETVIEGSDELSGGWQTVDIEPVPEIHHSESHKEEPHRAEGERSSFGMDDLLEKMRKDAEYSHVPPAAPDYSSGNAGEPDYSDEPGYDEPVQDEPVQDEDAAETYEADDVSAEDESSEPQETRTGRTSHASHTSHETHETHDSHDAHDSHDSHDGEGETFVADLDMVHGVGGLSNHTGIVKRYNYKPPLPSLLKEYPTLSRTASDEERAQGAGLVEFLRSFKVVCTLENIVRGPAVIMYELQPALGVKSSTISSMAPDIARYFKVSTVRVVTAMQGKNTIGVEVQSTTKETVGFRSLLSSVLNKNTMKVPFVLGKDLLGSPVSLDIYKAPHVLIAGSTGSGKSVCINSLIASILYTKTPSEVRLILVDPKQVELSMYSNIPHLLTPVITDSKRVIKMLDFCIVEMERRYKLISSMSVRNIEAYNDKIRQQGVKREFLPYIVVVLDEFGDIVTAVGKEFEIRVQRLAAKARAAGIHLVLATQRPSVDVITGTIKTNIPCRIAFRVASGTDSRTIIDSIGAESLLGYGDMLYKASTGEVRRVQGSFLSDQEVEDLANYCRRTGEPDFIDESFFEEDDDEPDDDVADDPSHMSDDEYYSTALKILYKDGEISTSFLQRKLNIGYNKAAKLIDRMDEEGLIGPGSGNKRRQLIKPME